MFVFKNSPSDFHFMHFFHYPLITGGSYQVSTDDCKCNEDVQQLWVETEKIGKKINNRSQRIAMQTAFRISNQGTAIQQGQHNQQFIQSGTSTSLFFITQHTYDIFVFLNFEKLNYFLLNVDESDGMLLVKPRPSESKIFSRKLLFVELVR